MEPINENLNVAKQRHGCVTAWLVLMIIANSLSAVISLFASEMITENLPGDVSTSMIILLGILGIANIIFSVMLFQWKKFGFWGFIITSIGAFIINLSIGLGIGQSLFGLVSIAILYGILQIKKDNIPAWDNLE
jgi:hypothetical protein